MIFMNNSALNQLKVMKIALAKMNLYGFFQHNKAISLSQQLSLLINQQEPSIQLFTYQKQVLSCAFNPNFINSKTLSVDARKRANTILSKIISVGSYPPGLGFQFIRQSVSQYIGRVDKINPPKVENIFLAYGVPIALQLLLQTLICKPSDAVMIPHPSHPLLTQSIALNGGKPVYYELNMQDSWQITSEALQQTYDCHKKKGKSIKAIIVVNPGNPTGFALNTQSITNVLEFAVKNGILVICEQVYQNGVFIENNNYKSCLSVLNKCQGKIGNECELLSINSVSTALGYHGCYMYFHNLNAQVMKQLTKVHTMGLFGSSLSQLIVQLITNPLQYASEQTKAIIQQEQYEFLRVKKAKAKILNNAFSQMENITFNYQQGAKYVYPSINLSQKAIKNLSQKEKNIDELYCNGGYKSTGTALIPGGYFGQGAKRYRFRMSPLIMSQKQLQMSLLLLKRYNHQFHHSYQK